MKRSILSILVLLMVVGVANAVPWAQTYPLNGSTVAMTNQQANSIWMPEVVLWKFAAATNVSTVVWIPEADYPFEYGDALQLTSTVTNGHVQIIRKGI